MLLHMMIKEEGTLTHLNLFFRKDSYEICISNALCVPLVFILLRKKGQFLISQNISVYFQGIDFTSHRVISFR